MKKIIITTASFVQALVFLFAGTNAQAADNTLNDIRFFSLAGNRLEVKLSFSKNAVNPNSFILENPARITLDFANTGKDIKWSNKRIGMGVAKSIAAIESGDRTRVVLNLTRMVPYTTRTEGKDVFLTIGQAKDSGSAGVGGSNRFEVENIDFRRGETGEGRVIITLSNPNPAVDSRIIDGKITIDIANTNLDQRLSKRLDVIDFATPVTYVDAFMDGSRTRVIITPKGEYEHLVYQSDNTLTIDVKPVDKTKAAKAGKDGDAQYTGEKLSLNFQDIDVRSVLQLIADFTSLNLVTSDNVKGRLTIRLNNVPWDQALDIVLKTRGLAQRKSGNVILVAPLEEIAQLEKKELEAQGQLEQLLPLRSEIVTVNFAKASELEKLIKTEQNSMLSSRGSVSVDARTNSLLLVDTEDRISSIKRMVTKLDIPVRQVLVESRVVIASNNFAKELGARFGVTRSSLQSDGNLVTTSGSVESTDYTNRVASENVDSNGNPTKIAFPAGTSGLPQRFNINMPVSAGNAGRFAVSLLNLGSGTLLDLELSALQTEGRGEIISNPRVITSDQQEALIEQGTEIPYLESTSSGATSVSFKKAVLSLKVKPQITPNENVIMDLTVNKDSVGEMFNGVPSIDTKEVNTQVLVENGETVVLGGIYEQINNKTVSKVPLLGDLPLLGMLFRTKYSQDDKSELLIFITPKIIKQSFSNVY